MNQTITVVVALITALAAIVAPLVTAQINRKSALELKSIETIYNKKLIAYLAFSEKCGKIYENEFLDAYQELHSAAYAVLVLANEQSKDSVMSLLDYIKHTTPIAPSVLMTHFECCMLSLNGDLQRSK